MSGEIEVHSGYELDKALALHGSDGYYGWVRPDPKEAWSRVRFLVTVDEQPDATRFPFAMKPGALAEAIRDFLSVSRYGSKPEPPRRMKVTIGRGWIEVAPIYEQ